jgi:hypothetical protein
MENEDLVAAIVKTPQKQFVHHVQSLQHVVRTHLQCKSRMEFGEAYQKMIASLF